MVCIAEKFIYSPQAKAHIVNINIPFIVTCNTWIRFTFQVELIALSTHNNNTGEYLKIDEIEKSLITQKPKKSVKLYIAVCLDSH